MSGYFLWVSTCNTALKNVLNHWAHLSQRAAQGWLFSPLLIVLLNPSSNMLIGFETRPLARKVLAIFSEPDYEYSEMRTDKVTMPPGFQLEISNISNFFNLASFKFY